jgi:hypothetical protein
MGQGAAPEDETMKKPHEEKTALELARQVAPLLGHGWTVGPVAIHEPERTFDDRARLKHFNGWQLSFADAGAVSCKPRDPRRVEVRGLYHRRDWYNMTNIAAPRITVAKNRGAATIAREIERRLLPEYEDFYKDLEQAYFRRDTRRFQEIEAINLITETTHGRIPSHAKQNLEPDRYSPGKVEVRFGEYRNYQWPSGKAYRFYEGRLNLELEHLTPNEAVTVLEALIALKKS